MKHLPLAVLLLVQATTQPPQTAGERYKSVRVLKDLPANQVIEVMSVIANSLGVTCSHCHADTWESDEKPMKEKARQMLLLTRRVDAEFGGRGAITCNTCHQGQAVPPAAPLVANAGWNKAVPPPPASALPSLEAVLERYRAAAGGSSAGTSETPRVATGTVTRYNGRTAAVSDKFKVTFAGPGAASAESAISYPPEGNGDWPFLLTRPAGMSQLYPQMSVSGRATIAGTPAIVVRATTRRGAEHTLFFAESSGLLLRRYSEKPTVLGPLPEEFDFSDYRQDGGGWVPYRVQWSRADYRVTFVIDRMQPPQP